jgi:hypothetical protein
VQGSIRKIHGGRTFQTLQRGKDLERLTRHPFHLAHMNYARLRAPMDHPDMAEFALAIDPINALAKATPGFVWSFDNDDPDLRNAVAALRDDPLLMPQLSVWTNLEPLRHFAFKSGHAMYYKRKREWFTDEVKAPYAVCWWRPAEKEPPTLVEAFERCDLLREIGPSPDAFDFSTAKLYPMPEA